MSRLLHSYYPRGLEKHGLFVSPANADPGVEGEEAQGNHKTLKQAIDWPEYMEYAGDSSK